MNHDSDEADWFKHRPHRYIKKTLAAIQMHRTELILFRTYQLQVINNDNKLIYRNRNATAPEPEISQFNNDQSTVHNADGRRSSPLNLPIVVVLIKLTKFAVALRLRCGSCKLIF